MSSLPAGAMPLNPEQTNQLSAAVRDLTADQLHWASGFVAGLAAAGVNRSPSVIAATNAPVADSSERITVLYGSQTGNGEEIATALVRQIQADGYSATAVSLADYKPSSLKREQRVSFVVSTHGEGDPPDDAELFHEYLLSDKAPQLEQLQYSVLALGDSSYVNFCQTGREFDARLSELGAKRFAPLKECDLDYEDAATEWSAQIVAAVPSMLTKTAAEGPHLHAVAAVSRYNKKNPFPAEVLVNQKITGGSSTKDVRHIELSLQGSGLTYEPGDAVAIVANNPPRLVDELLHLLDLDGSSSVTHKDRTLTLLDALHSELEITAVNLGFLRAWTELSRDEDLESILADGQQEMLTSYIADHQIIDVLRANPARPSAQTLVDMLRPLSPRSYSIASSQTANPDEVHLTVAAVRYEAHGSAHWGAASTHLADRLTEGDTVSMFIEKNSRFRLPRTDVPVIMIGPGTGIAPFRAFVEERSEQNASGANWLFFGDRNFDSDFLYQLEWQRYLKQGGLQRLDVAFSRDQREKIYVQDRILEHGAQLYRWIEDGAAIYVCGDAKSMAGDVHDALRHVIKTHGQLDSAAAEQKLKELQRAGRYQRDVY